MYMEKTISYKRYKEIEKKVMESSKIENIEKHLLKAEDDIRNGRVRDAEEVFKMWDEKYGLHHTNSRRVHGRI